MDGLALLRARPCLYNACSQPTHEASGRKAHGQPYRYPHMLRGHVRLPIPPQTMPSPASPNLPRSTGGRSKSPADRSIVATRRPTSEAEQRPELPRLTAPCDRAVNGRSRSRQGGGYMANLPLAANVATMTLMPTKMPFIGRG